MAYQSIVQLSYVDKLLNDVQLEFRERYKDSLAMSKRTGAKGGCTVPIGLLYSSGGSIDVTLARLCADDYFSSFTPVFAKLHSVVQASAVTADKPGMRSFDQSAKSQKTIESMIVQRAGEKPKKIAKKEEKVVEVVKETAPSQEEVDEAAAEIARNRAALFSRGAKGSPTSPKAKKKEAAPAGKKGKENRKWDMAGNKTDLVDLDFSSAKSGGDAVNGTKVTEQAINDKFVNTQVRFFSIFSSYFF